MKLIHLIQHTIFTAMKKINILKFLIILGCNISIVTAWSQDATFAYTGALQTYVVPLGVGSISIEATGAAGGMADDALMTPGDPGLGAYMSGAFTVIPGETLYILVGQEGEGAINVAGGGGGTFVWNSAEELLIAAGGGGGGGKRTAGDLSNIDGINGVITEDGTHGNGFSDGAGIGGDGGITPTALHWAAGGAGWNSSGADGSIFGCTYNSIGGERPLDGGAGGAGGGGEGYNADGGYGGGGGGNGRCGAIGGGGGGGYSGGGGGGEVISGNFAGGGGGGSFNSGEDQENLTGVGTGDGEVAIYILCTAILFEGIETEVCLGDEIILDAMSETGGTVMWSDGIINGEPFLPGGVGTHTYTATSTSGTDCSLTIEIIVHDLPEIVANADPETVCLGQELTLSGGGGASYVWSPGDIENGEPFIPGLGTMTYTVEGEDWYGCFNTAEVTVDVVDAPVVTANATDDKLCLGESVTLTGSGALTYEWDMGVEDGVSFTPETTGTFIYNVDGFVDGDGCFGEASIEITVYEVPTIDSYLVTEEVMGGDGSIDITVLGGTPAYDFDWDNDGAGEFGDPEDLIGIAGGTYVVVVKDVNDCEDSETLIVDSQAGVGDELINLLTVYPNPTDGIFRIETTGQFTYQILTANGQSLVTGQSVDFKVIDFSEMASGIYFIEVQNQSGNATIRLVR